jgi:hypothetical protein
MSTTLRIATSLSLLKGGGYENEIHWIPEASAYAKWVDVDYQVKLSFIELLTEHHPGLNTLSPGGMSSRI